MDILSIIIIGIGLAMDCFAVSISKGMCVKRFPWGNTLKMGLFFGIFQAIMPLIGYFGGKTFIREISNYDHWVAFGLLFFIGGKMLLEGRKPVDTNCEIIPNPFKMKVLITLAIATSIDALASGIIFIPFPHYIWIAVTIIGSISFLFTFTGMYVGLAFGSRLRFNVEILGGIILIGIGIKILLEHLFFK